MTKMRLNDSRKVIRTSIIIPETDDENESGDNDDALSRQASSLSLSYLSQRISELTSFPLCDPNQEIDSESSAEHFIYVFPISQPSHD